jgi:hypothetical protein
VHPEDLLHVTDFLEPDTFVQLSKEDEAATGGDEVEVRREDQDKINKFSRLHQREILLEEELKSKHVSDICKARLQA